MLLHQDCPRGLFQKNLKQGSGGYTFQNKFIELIGLLLYPWKYQTKKRRSAPVNSTKMCYNPWKIQGQKSTSLDVNSTWFLPNHPWKSHILFFLINLRVWKKHVQFVLFFISTTHISQSTSFTLVPGWNSLIYCGIAQISWGYFMTFTYCQKIKKSFEVFKQTTDISRAYYSIRRLVYKDILTKRRKIYWESMSIIATS